MKASKMKKTLSTIATGLSVQDSCIYWANASIEIGLNYHLYGPHLENLAKFYEEMGFMTPSVLD